MPITSLWNMGGWPQGSESPLSSVWKSVLSLQGSQKSFTILDGQWQGGVTVGRSCAPSTIKNFSVSNIWTRSMVEDHKSPVQGHGEDNGQGNKKDILPALLLEMSMSLCDSRVCEWCLQRDLKDKIYVGNR